MNTIQHMWKMFEKSAINTSAGETQRAEMRLAFYAGFIAYSTLLNVNSAKVDGGYMSSEAFDAVYEGLQQEMIAFVAYEEARRAHMLKQAADQAREASQATSHLTAIK